MLLERLLVVGEESQFRQAQLQTFLVQNTHDDAFAVVGRQAGDAQVNQLVADLASGCVRPAGCGARRWTCWTGFSAGR